MVLSHQSCESVLKNHIDISFPQHNSEFIATRNKNQCGIKVESCPKLVPSEDLSSKKMSYCKLTNDLKHTALVKPHVYNFDCDYCRYKCYSNVDCRDNNNNSAKKKKKKPLKTKSRTSFRDCALLKDITSELPYHFPQDKWPTTNTLELCETMQNLCLAPKVYQAFNKIPPHDQKIVNRMAERRNKKAILSENAWLAKKFWENEKYERDLLKLEQEEEYRRAVSQKRKYDKFITKARLEAISQRDKKELEQLRDYLYIKDRRLESRLRNIKLQKNINLCQKAEGELRKSEAVLQMLEGNNIDDDLRKQGICDRLENRLTRAQRNRQMYKDSTLKRVKYQNYLEQILHEENYKETLRFEKLQKEELKRRIKQKERRMNKFVEKKQNSYRESIERAKISAGLRDLVRRSVSPDGFNFAPAISQVERPPSNISLESYFKSS